MPSFLKFHKFHRNFRSLYDDEHLYNMVAIAASMRNVCGRNDNDDIGQCRV